MFDYIDDILAAAPDHAGDTIGHSREQRPIKAITAGNGKINISLLAGCHADEPVGPRFLRKLSAFLRGLEPHHPLIKNYKWWIVPHANPDGEAINKKWIGDEDNLYDITAYLRHAVREKPGDDVEFGFPQAPGSDGLRPENTAIHRFWLTAHSTFHLHASLHGMMMADGPWFLIDEAWRDRTLELMRLCAQEVRDMGYEMYDVDRKGEKGFSRIARGFCTRPDSKAMRAFFLQRDEPEEAEKFFPSSMEAIRFFGGDPLTIVSEMPLFLLPGPAGPLEWPNSRWQSWQNRLVQWKEALMSGQKTAEQVGTQIREQGLEPMPIADQMRLQWRFISAAIHQVEREMN